MSPRRAVGFSAKAAHASLGSTASRGAFRRSLLRWYSESARDLPWRRTRDPYAIWLSEIMLQQTQVATVIAYYERFLAVFPTISALAAAPEEEVLKLWEGLGYYRRARQLHAAAQRTVSEHGGAFPIHFQHISALPGIGRYTAGAIASFAFDEPRPIVEANTMRLYCRLLGLRQDPRGKHGQEQLWRFAEQILPQREPGRVNQALIELGSQICKPRNPLCESCPVERFCAARKLNLVDSIPLAKKKTPYEDSLEAAVIVRDQRNQILLRRRGDEERWAGMWDFPRGVLATGPSARAPHSLNTKAIVEFVRDQTGARIKILDEHLRLRHGVTRFRIELVCFNARLTKALQARDGLRWVRVPELKEIALSVSARKLALSLSRRKTDRD